MNVLKKVAEDMKRAVENNTFEKYLPAYTSAVGGYLGSRVKSVLPKRLQTAGAIGGTILGTGAGLHGGEVIGKKVDARVKTAEEEKSSPTATLAKSILGFGVGTGAGYLGMKGVDAAMRAAGGGGISSNGARLAIPVVTGALGMAVPYFHQQTVEKMRQAHLKKLEERRGRQGT